METGVDSWFLREFRGLIPEPRHVADRVQFTERLSGRDTDSAGASVPLESDSLVEVWNTLRSKYPSELGPAPLEDRLR
jgi:hypothetical protein